MKCKRCGYSCRDINTMRKHYQKKHPAAMKRKKKEKSESKRAPFWSEHKKGGLTAKQADDVYGIITRAFERRGL